MSFWERYISWEFIRPNFRPLLALLLLIIATVTGALGLSAPASATTASAVFALVLMVWQLDNAKSTPVVLSKGLKEAASDIAASIDLFL